MSKIGKSVLRNRKQSILPFKRNPYYSAKLSRNERRKQLQKAIEEVGIGEVHRFLEQAYLSSRGQSIYNSEPRTEEERRIVEDIVWIESKKEWSKSWARSWTLDPETGRWEQDVS